MFFNKIRAAAAITLAVPYNFSGRNKCYGQGKWYKNLGDFARFCVAGIRQLFDGISLPIMSKGTRPFLFANS